MSRKKSSKAGETKEQKFVRLATARMNKVVKDLNLVKQLMESKNYSMTEEQVSKITDTINRKNLDITESFLNRDKKKEKVEENFSF